MAISYRKVRGTKMVGEPRKSRALNPADIQFDIL